MFKVALIMGVAGACRKDELLKMKLDDVNDKENVLIVQVPDTKTHTSRTFTITNGLSNWLSVYRKYIQLRTPNTTHKRLFVNYRNGKCTSQVVGINTFGKIPERIAEFLKLKNPKEYTGHCFRRTSATLLADAGGDILSLKRHGGWKSSSVAEGYVENSLKNKICVSEKIIGTAAVPAQTVVQMKMKIS